MLHSHKRKKKIVFRFESRILRNILIAYREFKYFISSYRVIISLIIY